MLDSRHVFHPAPTFNGATQVKTLSQNRDFFCHYFEKGERCYNLSRVRHHSIFHKDGTQVGVIERVPVRARQRQTINQGTSKADN